MLVKNHEKKKIFAGAAPVFLLLAALWGGCDMLEADRESTPGELQLKDEAIYLTPQTSGIIDLRSLLTKSADVRLAVTSQPRFGKLESLGNDLLQYVPNDGVMEAKDGFAVSMFSDNNSFLGKDSVIIIITPDSTAIPCGVWAMTDYVYNITGPVIIDVLANDTACNVDSTRLEVTLAEIEMNGDPGHASFGRVELLTGGRIRYTPGSEFAGEDKFIYRLRKPADIPNPGDPEEISHGLVYISRRDSCDNDLTAIDDLYTFGADSLIGADTVYLDVTGNDVFCAGSVTLTIEQEPEHGYVEYSGDLKVKYIFPYPVWAGMKDEFIYEICAENQCDQARVTIKTE